MAGSPFDASSSLNAHFGFALTALFLIFMGLMLLWESFIGVLSWLLEGYKGVKTVLINRLKEELLALGVVSLLLGFLSKGLTKMCTPIQDGEEDKEENRVHCPEGKEPLFPIETINSAHYLLFWIAVIQIIYTLLSLTFTSLRFRVVFGWEQIARSNWGSGPKPVTGPNGQPPNALRVIVASPRTLAALEGGQLPMGRVTLIDQTHSAYVPANTSNKLWKHFQRLFICCTTREGGCGLPSLLGSMDQGSYINLRSLLLTRVMCDPHAHELRTINLGVASEQLLHKESSHVHAHVWLQIIVIALLCLYSRTVNQLYWMNIVVLVVAVVLSAKLQIINRKAQELISSYAPEADLLRSPTRGPHHRHENAPWGIDADENKSSFKEEHVTASALETGTHEELVKVPGSAQPQIERHVIKVQEIVDVVNLSRKAKVVAAAKSPTGEHIPKHHQIGHRKSPSERRKQLEALRRLNMARTPQGGPQSNEGKTFLKVPSPVVMPETYVEAEPAPQHGRTLQHQTSIISQLPEVLQQMAELEDKFYGLFWFSWPHLILWTLELIIVTNASIVTIAFFTMAQRDLNTAEAWGLEWGIVIYNLLMAMYIGWTLLPEYSLLTTALATEPEAILHHLKWANVVDEEEEHGFAGVVAGTLEHLQHSCMKAKHKRRHLKQLQQSGISDATAVIELKDMGDGAYADHQLVKGAKAHLMDAWTASLALRSGVLLPAHQIDAAQSYLGSFAPLYLGLIATWRQKARVMRGWAKPPRTGYTVYGGVWLAAYQATFNSMDTHGTKCLSGEDLMSHMTEAFHVRLTKTELAAMLEEVTATTQTTVTIATNSDLSQYPHGVEIPLVRQSNGLALQSVGMDRLSTNLLSAQSTEMFGKSSTPGITITGLPNGNLDVSAKARRNSSTAANLEVSAKARRNSSTATEFLNKLSSEKPVINMRSFVCFGAFVFLDSSVKGMLNARSISKALLAYGMALPPNELDAMIELAAPRGSDQVRATQFIGLFQDVQFISN